MLAFILPKNKDVKYLDFKPGNEDKFRHVPAQLKEPPKDKVFKIKDVVDSPDLPKEILEVENYLWTKEPQKKPKIDGFMGKWGWLAPQLEHEIQHEIDRRIYDIKGEFKKAGIGYTEPPPHQQRPVEQKARTVDAINILRIKPDYDYKRSKDPYIIRQFEMAKEFLRQRDLKYQEYEDALMKDKTLKYASKNIRGAADVNTANKLGLTARLAFVVPKEGKSVNSKNIEDFEYIPNFSKKGFTTSDISKLKKEGEVKVGEIFDHEILDRPEYSDIKNYKVKIGGEENGTFDTVKKEIMLKKGTNASMDRVLNHEIQHAIDFKNGMEIDNSKVRHDSLKHEQLPVTNEYLYGAEKLLMRGASKKVIDDYFDKKIKRAKKVKTDVAQDKLRQLEDAKRLFNKINKIA